MLLYNYALYFHVNYVLYNLVLSFAPNTYIPKGDIIMNQNTLPTLNMKAIGCNIKRLRKENGYTVRYLQSIFRFNEPQSIYKWQRGDCLPTVENLLVLSRLFNIPMEGILVYDEVPFPHFISYPESFCFVYISQKYNHFVPH